MTKAQMRLIGAEADRLIRKDEVPVTRLGLDWRKRARPKVTRDLHSVMPRWQMLAIYSRAQSRGFN